MIYAIIGLFVLVIVLFLLFFFIWGRITYIRNSLLELIEESVKQCCLTISDNNSFFKEYVNDKNAEIKKFLNEELIKPPFGTTKEDYAMRKTYTILNCTDTEILNVLYVRFSYDSKAVSRINNLGRYLFELKQKQDK